MERGELRIGEEGEIMLDRGERIQMVSFLVHSGKWTSEIVWMECSRGRLKGEGCVCICVCEEDRYEERVCVFVHCRLTETHTQLSVDGVRCNHFYIFFTFVENCQNENSDLTLYFNPCSRLCMYVNTHLHTHATPHALMMWCDGLFH